MQIAGGKADLQPITTLLLVLILISSQDGGVSRGNDKACFINEASMGHADSCSGNLVARHSNLFDRRNPRSVWLLWSCSFHKAPAGMCARSTAMHTNADHTHINCPRAVPTAPMCGVQETTVYQLPAHACEHSSRDASGAPQQTPQLHSPRVPRSHSLLHLLHGTARMGGTCR